MSRSEMRARVGKMLEYIPNKKRRARVMELVIDAHTLNMKEVKDTQRRGGEGHVMNYSKKVNAKFNMQYKEYWKKRKLVEQKEREVKDEQGTEGQTEERHGSEALRPGSDGAAQV